MIEDFISHAMSRAGSVRGSEYKRFPPSKCGPLMIIEGFISHAMSRTGSVRGSEYKRFHLPAPLTIPTSKRGPLMISDGHQFGTLHTGGMALPITENAMNCCFFKIP